MTTVRKHMLKKIVTALAVFGIAGTPLGVQAQAAHEGSHGHAMSQEQREARRAELRALSPEQRQEKIAAFRAQRAEARAEKRAARQARLAAALQLTPAQQPAWQAFVASTTPPQQGERAARRLTQEQRAALTAPQRLERRLALQKERTARMEERLSALNSLYAGLTPEQRKIFDDGRQRRGGRHQHGPDHARMMRG